MDEKVIEAYRRTRYDPRAKLGVSLFDAAYVWSDERPKLPDNSPLWELILPVQRDLLRHRASLMAGEPTEPGAEVTWNEMQELCPDWPGFRPERRDPALKDALKQTVEDAFAEPDKPVSEAYLQGLGEQLEGAAPTPSSRRRP